MIIVHILLTIVFYLVLMYLSINLLGLFVRGFFTNPELEKLKKDGSDFVKQQVAESEGSDKWLNIIAFLLIVGYLYATFYFWNIGVTVIALVLMLVRLPDLIWEIKHGKKITVNVAKQMRKNALYFITTFFTTFFTFAALPALYYFLYHF